ncbi:bifunctional phosphopantothenoylcysteine decarboxylase/phosphopantothenate--cysteine ligase CoaBC [Lactobacillus gigeriorum]|uniref:Coenzyme A biosynthesis bifunctional protein CoaBC n=1 Tax=Lactobacillus gigeriorum DSM 23908 = CRBIP 24.85 TaxID=1423751 RepID=I7LGL2_9LACO|nr:bifunctional phosphopantothenoylcysteine decarboxylase/phosphopantothenate--cysteine ligase CoaBC [Lactobacillus gigeriorum]KRN14646.1 pantothenate metabolism flavoprotein [Lactobacillus gigeriorum DSM 23908 = CRBIP 24.85]CCI87758.1 Coenzyme A biosynthesis bifunctional protein CoaBC [Lactobacillus gigeriorum DSM 23908 = CRBIP 24.85]
MRITVYLTGGIAAYKAVEVIRQLQKQHHEVKVVMTKNAQKFVTTNLLAALTKEPVLDDLWTKDVESSVPHVALARWTELAVIVPATANFMAKIANGLADDAASTTLLATNAPKLIVPAMNDQMWLNPATQRNLTILKKDGFKIMEPTIGLLAEGYAAKGRMPEPDQIVAWVENQIHQDRPLKGKKIIISAGGTIESIDPVRFIGNRSSGKMGIAIAEAARDAGAEVTLVYGNVSVALPEGINLIKAESAQVMYEAIKKQFASSDALIMAAAVADWRAEKVANKKMKKQPDQQKLQLELVRNIDILQTIGQIKRADQLLIGFAAETNDLLENAQAKLAKKGADYIVANDVSQDVFGADQDQVVILSKNKKPEFWPRMTKQEVANKIIDELLESLKDDKKKN